LGGIGAASLWGEDVKELDIRIWPTAGFSLAFHLPAFLGLETDLVYASKGSAFSEKEGDRTKVTTFTAHTVDIPLLLKVTAPTGTEVTPFFFGGPGVCYFLTKRVTTGYITLGSGGIINPEDATPLIAKEDIPNYEVNLTFGGGLEWGLGTFQLRVNLAQDSLDKTGSRDVRTVLVALMAGFIF
jgi:hypothetical protein